MKLPSIVDLRAKAQHLLHQPRTRKIGAWAAGVFIVFGLIGALAGPPLAKSILLESLSASLHRPVSIEKISINPYALSASIKGLSVKTTEGQEVFGFESLYVNFGLSSLFRGAPVINELELTAPHLQVARLSEQRYDVSDLIDAWSQPSEGPGARFAVHNIQVSGGKVTLVDRTTGVTHRVEDMVLRLPFISNLPSQTKINVQPHFSAKVNGAPLVLEGRSRPFDASRESELVLDLDQLNLVNYLAYVPVKLPFVVKSAVVNAELKLLFRQADQEPATLKLTGDVHVKDFKLHEANGSPLMAWKQFDIGIDSLDLLDQKIALGKLHLTGLEQSFQVDAQGKLNWLDIASRLEGNPGPAKKEAAGKPFHVSVHSFVIDDAALIWRDKPAPAAGQKLRLKHGEINGIAVDTGKHQLKLAAILLHGADARLMRSQQGGLILPQANRTSGSNAGAPWGVTIDRIAVSGSALRYEEEGSKESSVQQVEDLQFTLDGFSTEAGKKAKLSLKARVNEKGSIAVGGDLQMQPLLSKLDLDLVNVPILPVQAYFSDKLNISLVRGHLSGKGSLNLSQGKEGLGGGFSGQLAIGDLHSVDKVNNADFLRWKTLNIDSIETSFQPFSLTVGEVALSDFYARMIVTPEGKLNLAQIVRMPAAEKPAASGGVEPASAAPATLSASAVVVQADPPKAVAPIRINKVVFKNGNVRFSDFFVKPNYTVNIGRINGNISGLSSATDSLASLELHGGYGNAAPVDVVARLNPLAAKTYLDLKGEIRGVDLTTLSPYSGKYAGYAIEKGKLSLFVTYKLENQQLTAENRVFLDQLTFGDKVESAEATSLPVKLAVALLKNGRGEIDINLPISGSLNDPQFSVGSVIVRVIVNLFVKAVTSPFALLGSMFSSGGEELSSVDFVPGQSRLTPETIKKLEALAKAMNERPALKLEITGRVDPHTDLEGGKRAAIDRAVRVEKQRDLVKRGIESDSLGKIEVDAKEYPEYLRRVYKEASFSKPRNLIGLQKDLPVEEMEKLLIANTEVSHDDLRQLASRRGQVVQTWLVGEGKVPMERVFLLAPKLSGDAKDGEKANGSRVDFSLR